MNEKIHKCTVREHQMCSLKILQVADKICRENDIPYFLTNGTLLGAVREKGFISWDDDADLFMLREDYERFCKVFDKYPDSKFFLQNVNTDKGFFLPFLARVCMNDTYCWPKGYENEKFHTGLFVDIYPLDYGFSDKFSKYIRRKICNFLHG